MAKPRVLIGFMLACLAAALLCLAGGFLILTLHSPRFFNMDRPWFDGALDGLGGLFVIFALASLVFKFLVVMSRR
jgi:hypothetical protein